MLRSTLVLTDAACTATKIGPKHLLVPARCVVGNTAFDVGNVLNYRIANTQPAVAAADPQSNAAPDSGSTTTSSSDGGSDAGDAGRTTTTTDAGAASTSNTSDVAIIESVKINDTWSSKCKTPEVCGVGKVGAGDAPDVAVVILKDNLDIVPTIPVDLDPVSDGDQLAAVSSGCDKFDADQDGTPKVQRTVAVPVRLANHKGSQYQTASSLLNTFGTGYIVTPGVGWLSNGDKLCKRDIGAPMFRTSSMAVTGIASSFTVYDAATKLAPVTVAHTRLDGSTRFKVGEWLKGLGAETIHTCSESAGGCQKLGYDGGSPDLGTTGDTGSTNPGDGGTLADGGDAGTVETPPPGDDTPHAEPLPTEDDSYGDYSGEEDYADAAVAPKKKKAAAGGCNAAHGEIPTGELGLAFGLGLVIAAARRRSKR